MGLFSSSKSSTDNFTETKDNRAVADGRSIIGTDGANITVESQDNELIGQVLGASNQEVNRALNVASNTIGGSLKFADDALDATRESQAGAMRFADDALDANRQAQAGAMAFADDALYQVGQTQAGALAFADDTLYQMGQAQAGALDFAEDVFGMSQATVDESIDAVTEANIRTLDANQDNTDRAFNFAEETNFRALESVNDAFDNAFDFGEEMNFRALAEIGENNDTLADTLEDAFEFARISHDTANQAWKRSSEALAAKSQDAPSAVSETLQKSILIGLGIVSAAIVISRLPNK